MTDPNVMNANIMDCLHPSLMTVIHHYIASSLSIDLPINYVQHIMDSCIYKLWTRNVTNYQMF